VNRAEAAREAKALVAEWIWQFRATDDETWQQVYPPADLPKVLAEIDRIRGRFEEQAGPSLFYRQRAEGEK
jgi:hypothetical protein